MKQFKLLNYDADEFFEGFKAPEKYFSFGAVIWGLDMDNVDSNLFILKKTNNSKINEIVDFFKTKQDNAAEDFQNEHFSVITLVESENFLLLMTFCSAKDGNALHHGVDVSNTIQLLDDCTSTNDCLVAFNNLKNDKEKFSENEYKEIYQLLESQLTEQGLTYIKQYDGFDEDMKTIVKKPKM